MKDGQCSHSKLFAQNDLNVVIKKMFQNKPDSLGDHQDGKNGHD